MNGLSLSEIRRRGAQRENYLYFTVISNGPGAVLAWLADRVGVTPNWVTIGGALLCLPAVALNLTGHIYWALAVFHLFFVFDCADGILARATDQKSALGAYLDDLAHEVFHPFFLMSLALRFHWTGNPAAGFVCMAAAIANSLFRANYDLLQKRAVSARAPRESGKTWSDRLRYLAVGSFNYPNLLVGMTVTAWLTGALVAYLGYSGVMACLYVLFSSVRTIINARKE